MKGREGWKIAGKLWFKNKWGVNGLGSCDSGVFGQFTALAAPIISRFYTTLVRKSKNYFKICGSWIFCAHGRAGEKHQLFCWLWCSTFNDVHDVQTKLAAGLPLVLTKLSSGRLALLSPSKPELLPSTSLLPTPPPLKSTCPCLCRSSVRFWRRHWFWSLAPDS